MRLLMTQEQIQQKIALKYDSGIEKLPWDLLPIEATEGMLRVLLYGKRKYSICNKCGARIYPNARLDGDPPREDCPKCNSKDICSGAHNWRKGFAWTRLIAAAFRHLKAILQGEDFDPESGELHACHLLCMVAFLASHQILKLGIDDRYTK